MKILQISISFKPAWEAGGTTRVVYDMSCCLANKGHDVTVYTTDRGLKRVEVQKNKPVRLDNLIVYYFSNISNYMAIKLNIVTPYYLLFMARKQIKNFDIIHIHEHRTFMAVIISYFAKKNNIPYIIQAHGSVMPFFQKTLFKKIFDIIWGNNILNASSKVIALNETESEQYKLMDIPKDKIEIVPNGIDLVDYDNLPDNGLFRKRYNIKDDERIILYLGRIHKRKRIEILIKAYSLLFDDFDDFKLVIVGPDDGYMDYLKKIVSKESLTDKVLFTGPIYGKNKLEVYTDADIFVYPSVSEIFGLSQLESLLCGTPIIVSDDSGCGKMTDDGLGYTFKEGNIVDLEKKMIYLIQNYENGISMVKNAKQLIKEKFEIEIVTKKFEIIYNHCIQNL